VGDINSLGELVEYAQRQVERLTEMQAHLAEQYAEARSPRGHVRARTGPGGALQELHIAPDALRLAADELAAEVTAAVTTAQREYAERADEIMAPLLHQRPTEQSMASVEAGMSRLEAIADDLERIAERRGLVD
jgi:DNA-binding protein YbaB